MDVLSHVFYIHIYLSFVQLSSTWTNFGESSKQLGQSVRSAQQGRDGPYKIGQAKERKLGFLALYC